MGADGADSVMAAPKLKPPEAGVVADGGATALKLKPPPAEVGTDGADGRAAAPKLKAPPAGVDTDSADGGAAAPKLKPSSTHRWRVASFFVPDLTLMVLVWSCVSLHYFIK